MPNYVTLRDKYSGREFRVTEDEYFDNYMDDDGNWDENYILVDWDINYRK